jgi:hypothetical protein
MIKAQAASKTQHMLEVFDSFSKLSWAAENAPRLELMTNTIVAELVSHTAFYAKNGASFEGNIVERSSIISTIRNVLF